MANPTDIKPITGVYRPQVDLFNELIERVNKATTSNKSLLGVLNAKLAEVIDPSKANEFKYVEETGLWSWGPKETVE